MIKYDKLFTRLKEAGINSVRVRKENIMSQSAYYGIRHGRPVQLTMSTIDRLCALLDCQPGDLVEWVPDPDPTED